MRCHSVNNSTCVDLRWVTKGWKACVYLRANSRRLRQVHLSLGQTESQVDASFITYLHDYHQVHNKNERSQKCPRHLIGRYKVSVNSVPVHIVRGNSCANNYCHGNENKPKRVNTIQPRLPKSAESWGPVRILRFLREQEINEWKQKWINNT